MVVAKFKKEHPYAAAAARYGGYGGSARRFLDRRRTPVHGQIRSRRSGRRRSARRSARRGDLSPYHQKYLWKPYVVERGRLQAGDEKDINLVREIVTFAKRSNTGRDVAIFEMMKTLPVTTLEIFVATSGKKGKQGAGRFGGKPIHSGPGTVKVGDTTLGQIAKSILKNRRKSGDFSPHFKEVLKYGGPYGPGRPFKIIFKG